MTGNTVLFALGVARQPPGDVVATIVAIASFFLGAFFGAALSERAASRALVAEIAILAVVAVLWYAFPFTGALRLALIALGSCAMGLQQAATERLHPQSTVSTTYQSGTVERIGTGLFKALRGDWRAFRLHAAIWLVYAASAVCVVELVRTDARIAGTVPFAAVLVVGIVLCAAPNVRARRGRT